jgi:hypothetical protein
MNTGNVVVQTWEIDHQCIYYIYIYPSHFHGITIKWDLREGSPSIPLGKPAMF